MLEGSRLNDPFVTRTHANDNASRRMKDGAIEPHSNWVTLMRTHMSHEFNAVIDLLESHNGFSKFRNSRRIR